MSVRAFTLDSGNNIYSEMYGNGYYQRGMTGPRATRNATVSNQKILARNIAASHNSELKNAYEYIEDGNVSGFQGVIDNIFASEATKQRTYNIKDEEIQSAIESAYQQVVGADYDTSIAGTKMSSERTGFLEGITLGIPKLLGIGDYTSSAEYIAQRRNTEVNEVEKAERLDGQIKGVATAAGLGFAGACIMSKGALLTGIATFCASNPIGWVVADAAVTLGGIALIATNMTKQH